jgi:IclR family acetate operon transcriptional repressor
MLLVKQGVVTDSSSTNSGTNSLNSSKTTAACVARIERLEALSTVEKAIDVLFHLHGETAAQGVTSIGRSLGLPKSSTHRLLSALSRRGLVEKDESGRYRPGIGLVALGLGALDREPVVAAARPVMQSEAETLGETVFLVAARAGRLLVLDKAEGSAFLRASPRVGSSVPVHATAVGKLYLAFGAGEVELGDGDLEQFCDATVTDRSRIEREINRVAADGHASNSDEWIGGLSVVAAPVRVSLGGAQSPSRMEAAVAFAATTVRMQALGIQQVALRAVDAAARIALRLEGGQP